MEFDLVSLWEKMGWVARFVVILLAVMAVYSLGVALERWIVFLRGRKQSLAYLAALDRALAEGQLDKAIAAAKTHEKGYLAKVIVAGLREYQVEKQKTAGARGRDEYVTDAEHALQRAGDREM